MLTYNIDKNCEKPIYIQIYEFVKNDISDGKILPNEKLPSKRKFARHLNVSIITVENAYSQLVSEGYINSVEKKGYYACKIETIEIQTSKKEEKKYSQEPSAEEKFINLSQSSVSSEDFPFATWSKLIRKILSEKDEELLRRQSYKGNITLRKAISDYLRQFRGIDADCEQIIIGSGTENIYGMVGNILGKDSVIGIENPGYSNIAKTYRYEDIKYKYIDMDKNGVSLESLRKSGADIIHISPSHHFPSGITTPIGRRTEILNWCYEKKNRYIIEDDYDSEFRFNVRPIPPLYNIDKNHRVIYINTFSKSISPAIRISYMIMPMNLIKKSDELLSFSSGAVSTLNQLTLAEFINGGYFERHINKMVRVYRMKRDIIIAFIKKYLKRGTYTIFEQNTGLHFILKLETDKSDEEIKEKARLMGVKINFLSEYYVNSETAPKHLMMIMYTGINKGETETAIKVLAEIIN